MTRDSWVRLPANRDDKITLKPYVDFREPTVVVSLHTGAKEDVEFNSVDLSGDELRKQRNKDFSESFRV